MPISLSASLTSEPASTATISRMGVSRSPAVVLDEASAERSILPESGSISPAFSSMMRRLSNSSTSSSFS